MAMSFKSWAMQNEEDKRKREEEEEEEQQVTRPNSFKAWKQNNTASATEAVTSAQAAAPASASSGTSAATRPAGFKAWRQQNGTPIPEATAAEPKYSTMDRYRPGGVIPGSTTAAEAAELPEAYRSIHEKEDYLEKSKYVPTGSGKQGITFREAVLGKLDTSGYDDPVYEYVNGNTEAINRIFSNESVSGSTLLGTDSRFLNQLNSTEKGTYNYIHATQGKDAADQFLRDLQSTLNARQRAEEEKYLADEASKGPLNAARMSAFSTAVKPLSILSYAQQAGNVLSGEGLDPNAGYNRWSYAPTAIRSAVSKKIEDSGKWGKVGSYAYNLGMSMSDFLYTTLISGGMEPLALAVMGTEAAADSTLAAKQRGMSDTRSLATGTIAGLIEALTEKIGFDALFKTDIVGLGKAGFAKFILRNAGSEAAEEGTSDLLNWLIDDLYDIISGTNESEFKELVSAYEENGLTHGQALTSAIGDRAKELGLDTLGGFLSGLFMSGAKSGFNAIQFNEMGKEVFKSKNARSYVVAGLSADPNTEAYEYAKTIQNKLNANQKVSNIEMGQLAAALYDSTAQKQQAQETLLSAVYENLRSGQMISNRTAQAILDNPQALTILFKTGATQMLDTSNRSAALNEIKFAVQTLAFRRAVWEGWTNQSTNAEENIPFIQIPERATPGQTTPEQTAQRESENPPAWYTALMNSPRPMDQPARRAPALTLPQLVQAPQEAQSAGGAPTLPPQNIAPTESVPAGAPVDEATPAPSSPVRSEELTPEPERGIVNEESAAPAIEQKMPTTQKAPVITAGSERPAAEESQPTAPTLPTTEETRAPKTEDKAPVITAEKPTEEKPAEKKPHEVLAESLIRYLDEGNTITPQDLQRLAEEAYGGSRGSGAYDIKTAYDALELAVNKYLVDADFVKEGNGGVEAAERTEKGLEQFMRLLPTQSVRTEEQQQYQQFSTPPNIAYLAAWAANISDADTVLEPSAGIGGLALWPKAWGATVYGNELSERRAEILRSLGLDEVFTENAEQINNILPDYVKPTVVLMNPPFSSTAGRTSTNKTANAKRHVEQALARLEDGGRLVAILGQGMANDSKTFAPWWNDLRKKYDIRANLSINGENYRKYGTTFDVQLVVIDKTGPQTGETITGSYDDLTEIPQALEGIRSDRTQPEKRVDAAGERGVLAPTGSERNGSVSTRPAGNPERPSGTASGNVRGEAPVLPGNGGRVQPGGAGENGLRLGGGENGSRVGGESSQNAGGVHSESQPGRNAGPESELPVRGLEGGEKPLQPKPAKKTAASQQKAGNDDNVYAEYIPPKTPVKGTQKHPAKIVESAAMAAVDAPQAFYTPNIPKELISSGALSDVQLTNIVYAGQAHSQMIPSQNKRKGYFIGDGTGVGKGRQLAGIILDNFRQGRTKAVWISQRQNLYADARRDWQAMGMNPDDVISSQKVKATASIGAKSGIYFTTYDTLANKSKTGQSRIDQLVDWLGKDFDGVICFDEAHTMGNVLGKQSKMGKTKPAERALAGAKLQDMLPNARIVYASATMATNVDEMAFAERLGLWGPGTQFNNVRDFVEKISAGGMAAMELVARDMKAMGLYQARSISYDGVEYETLQHDLTPMQKDIYDTMSRAWQTTLQNMNEAMSITGANLNGRARAAAKSAYYGALQRFYNQVLTSMAVPSVIKDMKKELAKGRSVVLQIVNTNEAETERQLAKQKETGESLEDLDITPREALLSFFRNSFPVQAYETYTDENGNELSRPVVDSNGNPVEDREAVAMRDRMIREIEQMKVPEGPLEMIFDAFGTENVAEVTGRSRRVVPGRDEYGNTVKIEEKRGAKSGEADATAFQDGQKRILIFSDAGGTGKSYHADRTAKNQQQRVHYLLQPGWSAQKAVQGFGRTHRSNEASAPIYKLVTTDVKGQKRFVSTVARRLDQLGALTKGQRQTGSGMFSARDNLESDLATDSLYNFYRALIDGKIEGLDAQDVLEKLGLYEKFYDAQSRKIKVPDGAGRDMSLFLNRILALEYDEQNKVFDAFSRIFDDAYETALANGTLDMGMETVRADKINILDDLIVRTDENTGATTNYVQAKLSEKARILQTVDDLRNMRGDFIGLYRKQNGDVVGVFRTRDKTESDGSVSKQYILQTPLERKISRYVEKTLKSECTRIPEKEWDKAWAAEVEKAPEYIDTVKHMLTGSLLPVWNRLPKSGNVKVQRLIADDGRQYLGRIIDAKQIDDVLKSLGVSVGRTKQSYTADDVIQRVYKNGDKATLEENRMALTRRRVGNEWRIEITGDNLYWLARNNPGIIQERINYKERYFIPNGAKQREVLEKILNENPVRDIEAVHGEAEVSYSRDAGEEKKKISANMTDRERYDILKDRKISLATADLDKLSQAEEKLESATKDAAALTVTERKKLFRKLGDEFKVFKKYGNEDVQLEFRFSRGNLDESLQKQRKNYDAFAKMLTCFDDVIENAIGIEVHNRNEEGYKPDLTLDNMYVLASAFTDGEDVYPVKLEIKEFNEGKDNSLHVAIALESIKKSEIVNVTKAIENGQAYASPSLTIKLADLLGKVNPSDTSFRKYIPAQFFQEDVSNFNGNTAPAHPENWKSERVGDKNKTPMSLTDIVNMIRHDFDIPVTTGNIRSPNARAQYRRQPQSVRSKITNSIPDIAHELGHHLDNIYDIQHKISKEAKKEILDAMPESFKSQYKDNQLAGEGVAEFLRCYLQNSETAAIDYPVFTEEFLGMLDSKGREAIEKLADEMNAYYSLSEETGNWPIHNREDKGTDFRSFGEKLSDMHSRFRTLFIDSMEPIRQVDKAAGTDVHRFAINSAYAGNRAYAAITGDLYDIRGNLIGDGLQKALKGIRINNKREYADFGMYLVCRHGPERLREGMRVFGNDAWNNTQHMEETAKDLEAKYPEFRKAADRLEEFQTNVLQAYGVDTGLYSQETMDSWLDRWDHYVPLNRWFSEAESKGQKRGFANQTGPYKKAYGSGREIINPVDNIVDNTVRLITTSIYNDVMQKLTQAVNKTEGLGWLMEQVPAPLARKTWDGAGLKSKTLEAFQEAFEMGGKPLDKAQEDFIQRILDEGIDDVLVQYGRGKAHGNIVTVMKDGSPEYWMINDADLLKSIANMETGRGSDLINILGRVNRFITGNITGMNVVWSLASNSPRDLGTLITLSKSKNVVSLLKGILGSYVNTIKGEKADALFKEYLAMGGGSTSAQTADKNMARAARKALQKNAADWLNPLESVEFISDMIERGPRYAEYRLCRTKYGMSPEEAFYAAMEVTTNFKRRGLMTGDINKIVPFFNASVQGVDRMARWLAADDIPQAQRKKGRAGRIAAFIGVSALLAALNIALNTKSKKDKDNFSKLSTFTKNNYFVLPMGNGKYLAIPKPRELGIPISAFERLFEMLATQNPHAFDDFWEYVTDNTLPGVVSGLAQGDLNSAIGDLGVFGSIHYLVSNQDFLGRPIVSSSLQNLEKKDQYAANTSKLAYILGQAFNLSPQQIDFIGNEIFGGFWSWQKALLPVSAESDITLGVKGKWVKDPLYSTDITNRLYNQRDKLEAVKNSNPEDVNAAINYRTVADMASFYGKYYKLARNEKETPQSRETRSKVLDMILGVEDHAGNTERAYRFMVNACQLDGGSALMPAVMETFVKDDDGKTYALTSEEYFTYQTRYDSLYYNYIRAAMDKGSMSDDEKIAVLKSAKKLAGIVAKGEQLQAKGATSEAYDKIMALYADDSSDVDEGELTRFLAAKSMADADDSGSLSNAELLSAVSGLRLPSEDEVALTRYAKPELGLKLQVIAPYGVSAEEYSKVLEILGPGTPSQERAEAAIDEVYGRTTAKNKKEKAAVWQSLGKKWKTSNNPYDPNAGSKVQSGLVITAK